MSNKVEVSPEMKVAVLTAIAEAGYTPDVGELLVYGDGRGRVAPGLLNIIASVLSQPPIPDDVVEAALTAWDENYSPDNSDEIAMRAALAASGLLDQVKALREALKTIAWGSEDKSPPFRAAPAETLRNIARQALNGQQGEG